MIPATDTLEQDTDRHPVRLAVRRLRRRGVVLTAVGVVAVAGVLSASLRGRRPDAEATAAPFVTDTPPTDSAQRVAFPSPAPRPPVVEVVAPGQATVSVNGVDVGKGRWRTD